jgi:hypothetical protein
MKYQKSSMIKEFGENKREKNDRHQINPARDQSQEEKERT